MQHLPKVHLRRVAPGAGVDDWARAAREALAACAGLAFVRKNDLIAIKLHVGEQGLSTFLPPEIAREAAAAVRERAGRPFLTDTAVLYSGRRSTGLGHTTLAIEHGFTVERTGAPFIPADGLKGNQERSVKVEGKHFHQVGVAAAIADSDGMVVVTHATGHLLSGMGATLKNVGMGCASRKGKLLQHSDTHPSIREDNCTACGACIESCPEQALTAGDLGKAQMDDRKCVGCGECIAACRSDAVGFRWDSGSSQMQEKMVEHAAGVLASIHRRAVFLVGLVNITKDCDCLAPGSRIVAKDIGFAASTDPVALDQAVLDLVEKHEGKRLDSIAYPKLDGTIQLKYAEQMGLGSRRYELAE